jgi:alpha-1,2-mannosyltransferase
VWARPERTTGAAALALAASVAVWVGLSLHAGQPFHPVLGTYFFDLRIYRAAAGLVVHGRRLYDTRMFGFYFTYPPLAAVAFVPLTVVGFAADRVAMTAVNLAALIALMACASRLAGWRGDPARRWALALAAAAVALWLEPVLTTIGYGQIDLVIALLVVADLTRSDRARTKGALIGVAAGLKLTPAIFIVYLLATGRRRAAGVATGTLAATIAAGFAVLPGSSARYWGGLFLDSGRVTGRADAGGGPADQSLRGALIRLDPALGADHRWVPIVAVVALAGLALAVRAGRRGDEGTGFALCAITGLLASPISWTHHWALAVPALLVLAVRARSRHSRPGWLAAGFVALIAATYSTWIVDAHNPTGVHLGPVGLLAADPYVGLGLAALAAAAVAECVRARRAPPDGVAPRIAPEGALASSG